MNLSSEKLVSRLCFQIQLVPLRYGLASGIKKVRTKKVVEAGSYGSLDAEPVAAEFQLRIEDEAGVPVIDPSLQVSVVAEAGQLLEQKRVLPDGSVQLRTTGGDRMVLTYGRASQYHHDIQLDVGRSEGRLHQDHGCPERRNRVLASLIQRDRS